MARFKIPIHPELVYEPLRSASNINANVNRVQAINSYHDD